MPDRASILPRGLHAPRRGARSLPAVRTSGRRTATSLARTGRAETDGRPDGSSGREVMARLPPPPYPTLTLGHVLCEAARAGPSTWTTRHRGRPAAFPARRRAHAPGVVIPPVPRSSRTRWRRILEHRAHLRFCYTNRLPSSRALSVTTLSKFWIRRLGSPCLPQARAHEPRAFEPRGLGGRDSREWRSA